MPEKFDLIVVGGGHAGCEAALAAARLGVKTALMTLKSSTIAALSCNPAIGGVGKGQLVREIDALGGAMGQVADQAAIQYRMLNTSKGEAVHSLRAQMDKLEYARIMQLRIHEQEGLQVIEGLVEGLLAEQDGVAGVILADLTEIRARRVILTNGTFLRGLMHTGDHTASGGRVGEGVAGGLTLSMEKLGFESGRLKTGTPPRLHTRSIDWSKIDRQVRDEEPDGFSHFLPPPRREWTDCYVTRTNEQAHDAIRANLHRSPMFSGRIEGVGPRYCPSIEDKVLRFPERDGHVVHLEPESKQLPSIYVNGVSTSLPADTQELVIRAIPGLEKAEFVCYGYAVEYDFFPPHQIDVSFESRPLRGLYLAGQICGTSGYEEAATQGLLAGINAAHSLLGREPFVLGRDQAYLGVLADDLVRCDPREPYRMFTSRAEYRLMLRHDNADLRLIETGVALGLVEAEYGIRIREKQCRIDQSLEFLKTRFLDGTALIKHLKRPGAKFTDLVKIAPAAATELNLSPELQQQVFISARYEEYIERQQRQVGRMHRFEALTIPADFEYSVGLGLRNEAREKLDRLRPRTLGQAQRIAGVTPADINIIIVCMRAAGLMPDEKFEHSSTKDRQRSRSKYGLDQNASTHSRPRDPLSGSSHLIPDPPQKVELPREQ